MISHEIVVDAERKRHTERGQDRWSVATTVNNGLDNMHYDGGMHSQIYRNGVAQAGRLLGVRDFTLWPNFGNTPARSYERPGTAPAIRHAVGPDGRLTIENESEYWVARWIVDQATGFVHEHSLRPRNVAQGMREEVRQYGPKAFDNGAVLPRVHVEGQVSGDRVISLVVKFVDDVDLAYHPGPLDFALAVPAGTLIVDGREDRVSPNKGTAHYPVDDVVAYADEMASRYRSIEPVLEIGRPAPPIRPAAWFDLNGPAAAPDLAGKVTLVDFWGYTSGPCMAELPEVQAAADRFADRSEDFILIGLHNSGPAVGEAAMFARKQGLTYRLAIDRPTDEDGWPGATFRSYGIHNHAVPAAAVIDRRGKVAFVGPFRRALQKAADLLGP